MPEERRRPRKCPSCGGDKILRGWQVPGIEVQRVPPSEAGPAVLAEVYSDYCQECGMVLLYTRLDPPASAR